MSDKTFVMIKPTAFGMRHRVIRDLELKLEDRGKRIATAVIDAFSADKLQAFYGEHRSKFPFWDELMEKGFVGKPAFAAVYEGENIIPIVRKIIGPTRVLENPYDTIRGKYGRMLLDQGRGIINLSGGVRIYENVIHATDETPGEFEREFGIMKDYFR